VAQVAEGSISAGLSRVVGRVRVDPGTIRGEAGPFEPRLVVPVSVEQGICTWLWVEVKAPEKRQNHVVPEPAPWQFTSWSGEVTDAEYGAALTTFER